MPILLAVLQLPPNITCCPRCLMYAIFLYSHCCCLYTSTSTTLRPECSRLQCLRYVAVAGSDRSDYRCRTMSFSGFLRLIYKIWRRLCFLYPARSVERPNRCRTFLYSPIASILAGKLTHVLGHLHLSSSDPSQKKVGMSIDRQVSEKQLGYVYLLTFLKSTGDS